jgi:hypothetical protein
MPIRMPTRGMMIYRATVVIGISLAENFPESWVYESVGVTNTVWVELRFHAVGEI